MYPDLSFDPLEVVDRGQCHHELVFITTKIIQQGAIAAVLQDEEEVGTVPRRVGVIRHGDALQVHDVFVVADPAHDFTLTSQFLLKLQFRVY